MWGPTGSFWGSYPQAAALALQEKYRLAKGVVGLIDGMLPGCGLSSSASVLLAYLHAFAAANDIELTPWDYAHLTRRAENKYIGLNNGILDQTSIVFGRRRHMLYIDTRKFLSGDTTSQIHSINRSDADRSSASVCYAFGLIQQPKPIHRRFVKSF